MSKEQTPIEELAKKISEFNEEYKDKFGEEDNPEFFTKQEMEQYAQAKVLEANEMLSLANGMLNHIKCINTQCDGNGAIQVAEDDFEPCQWCDEKIRIQEYLNTTKQK